VTIQQAIDQVIRKIPGAPLAETLDIVKCGDPSQPLRGIVSTFMATRAVLDQAVALGANLVITHEPTYYNHLDETDWLKKDAVFLSKRAFLEKHQLVVWRFHDYWHLFQPDGIVTGVIRSLGWEKSLDPHLANVYQLDPISLESLVALMKHRMGIQTVRLVGDPKMTCRRVALLVGAYGGRRQIELLRQPGVDVIAVGESPEWETCEYVRDAIAAGENKAFIVLGHANSEEAGMEYLAEWLQPHLPGVPIHYVKAGDPFTFL
jgi:putative NIF3 family GTP cyclohydrolase 1 type 2